MMILFVPSRAPFRMERVTLSESLFERDYERMRGRREDSEN